MQAIIFSTCLEFVSDVHGNNNQILTAIEDRLYQHEQVKDGLFFYAVTSSYLEGEENELAAFGYNRDRKQGKRQVVVGLLCNSRGQPLSIEVFEGNTQVTSMHG